MIGTAGHVDHGKSTLVRALTGRDPDRWDEEKRRGLTIDLGFAWTDLGSGVEVGFIDVPGHERFIKNMLAGVDAFDVALFVVAADEGWMPQSEEHLSVLDILEVRRGVIALTRADLTDADGLELARLDVAEHLEGTSLEGSPIVAVAAPDGSGVEEIRSALAAALAAVPAPTGDRPRMWVDRSFTVDGAGTVVTGTLTGGSLALDDVVVLYPGGDSARVRSLQSHERRIDRLQPGNRAAVNLAGIERADVGRGAMIGRIDDWRPTRALLADLSAVRSLGEPLRDRGSFHIHVGSGSWPVRLRLVDTGALEAGRRATALVDLPSAIPVKAGDRLVLREVGRQAVVAGGRVLDPAPHGRLREVRRSVEPLRDAAWDPDATAQTLLQVRGRGSLTEIAAHTGGGLIDAAVGVGDEVVSEDEAQRLMKAASALVAGYHEEHPLRPGMPAASLAEQLGASQALLEVLIGRSAGVTLEGASVRQSDFSGELGSAATEEWNRVREALDGAGPAPPRLGDLDIDAELLHARLRAGELIRVGSDFVYLPKELESIEERVRVLADGFTVANFRDALGVTRKHAVPLLEWLDAAGITQRMGDGRVVRR